MIADEGERGAVEPVGGPHDADTPVEADDQVALLAAIDRSLFPSGGSVYTAADLAAQAGVDVEIADRLWRAMGFTSQPEDRALFRDEDLAALRQAGEALARGIPLDGIIYQTRVMAAAMARVAEVASDGILEQVNQLRAAHSTDEQVNDTLGELDGANTERLLGYFYRRQLEAALWRKLARPWQTDSPALTVGFVDLVRFTAVTEGFADEELSELVDRFELMVHDAVTARGGRIVKMIGDEVMFVADEPADGVDIALDLVRQLQDDRSVPPARAGLDYGPVVAHGGDYFGPTVNTAARIVDVARPSSVVTSESLRVALSQRPDLTWRRLPPKRLKGVGRPALWAVARHR